MKKLFIFLCLFFVASIANATLKEEFQDANYGVHCCSIHNPNNGANNGNLGFYIVTKSGWTAGHYHNSLNTYTNYYGWTTPEWYRVRLSLVVASGYQDLYASDHGRWQFVPAPTIRLLTLDNVAGIRHINFRCGCVPGLTHLMVDAEF